MQLKNSGWLPADKWEAARIEIESSILGAASSKNGATPNGNLRRASLPGIHVPWLSILGVGFFIGLVVCGFWSFRLFSEQKLMHAEQAGFTTLCEEKIAEHEKWASQRADDDARRLARKRRQSVMIDDALKRRDHYEVIMNLYVMADDIKDGGIDAAELDEFTKYVEKLYGPENQQARIE